MTDNEKTKLSECIEKYNKLEQEYIRRSERLSGIKKSVPGAPKPSEDQEQCAVVEYCELRGIDVVHVPNEGKRSKQYGVRMKRMGLQKGFPDLFFPAARKEAHGLFIEMKAQGKSATIDQVHWIKKLREEGYSCFVCQGFDRAKEVIDWYFDFN